MLTNLPYSNFSAENQDIRVKLLSRLKNYLGKISVASVKRSLCFIISEKTTVCKNLLQCVV